MALSIPNPEIGDWTRWSSEFVGYNPELGNQVDPRLQSWQSFAVRLSLILPATPRPEFFKTWQAWAHALRQALQGQ